MQVAIAYEDDWLVVVDKPSGLPVHAAQGAPGPDLVSLLAARGERLGLLHRLDREASGLVLLSRRPEANAPLQRQLEAHTLGRVYAAILAGGLAAAERLVDRPIPERALGRDAARRPPPPGSKPARSRFVVVRRLTGATLCEVHLETGRKHQIRVHAASIGHPLLGDRRYGGPAAPRLALHASRLTFRHPADGREVVVDSALPPDLVTLVASLSSQGDRRT